LPSRLNYPSNPPTNKREFPSYPEFVLKLLKEVETERFAFLAAWIAQTGLKPTDAKLVTKLQDDGSIAMWFEPKA
jgi:hypothetical protein